MINDHPHHSPQPSCLSQLGDLNLVIFYDVCHAWDDHEDVLDFDGPNFGGRDFGDHHFGGLDFGGLVG